MGDGRIYMCLQCNRQQPGDAMQCECGNIDPIQFEVKDIYHRPINPDETPVDNSVENVDNSPESATKTMVEKTPHVELKEDVDLEPNKQEKAAPKDKKKKKKTKRK